MASPLLAAGALVTGFALAALAASIVLAAQGRVVASLVAAAVGGTSLVVGADLIREAERAR